MNSHERGPLLRIVSINDVYLLSNLPRLQSLLDSLKARLDADQLLLTLPGDFVAPSLLSSIDSGRAMVECLNAVGVTHVTFGNHEDDISPAELCKRVGEFRGCWLGTNVRGFARELRKSDVITVLAPSGQRVRVGLVGVVIHDPLVYRGTPFGAESLDDANECALKETARLMREEGCSTVIPLTHQTMASDRLLADAQQNPRYPVILGGHEHELLLEQHHGTWIVKAGADAFQAAIIELQWPSATDGTAPAQPTVTVQMVKLADYPSEPAMQARVESHLTVLREIEDATLVTIGPDQSLSSVGTRMRQTSMGSLLCGLLRDVLGADACVLNGGAIRASKEYRERFTYGELKAEVPFDNEVVVVSMEGSVLRDAVAASRSAAPREFGGFLQVDSQMSVDPETHQLTRVAGEPLDSARIYSVALVRNLLLGLDRIAPLVAFAQAHPERVPPEGTGQVIKQLLVAALAEDLWHRLGTFEQIDAQGDGVVDSNELSAAIATATARPRSAVTMGLVLAALDADKDGVVSRAEAEAYEHKDKRRKH